MNFVLGFLGALTAVALFVVGGLCGWYAHKTFMRHTTHVADKPGEKERRMLKEQQQAFHVLQNYSAERAYGMMTDPEFQREEADI
jgi:hypothetical protein